MTTPRPRLLSLTGQRCQSTTTVANARPLRQCRASGLPSETTTLRREEKEAAMMRRRSPICRRRRRARSQWSCLRGAGTSPMLALLRYNENDDISKSRKQTHLLAVPDLAGVSDPLFSVHELTDIYLPTLLPVRLDTPIAHYI